MFALVLGFVILALVYAWINRPKRPPGFPPGPPTKLIFGNTWELLRSSGQNFPKFLEEMQQKYDSTMVGLVDIFGTPMVHIFDVELMKAVSSRKDCSGRPVLFPIAYRNYMKKQGIMFSEGAVWHEHRKFALSHLKNLGFGKNSMNDVIIREFDQIAANLREVNGRPVEIDATFFNMASLNVIWKMIAGERYDATNREIAENIKLSNQLSTVFGPQHILNYLPWLRYIIPEVSGFNIMKRMRDSSEQLFKRFASEHQNTRDDNYPRDFIDAFMKEMETENAKARKFDMENLCVISMDFFLAGSETTATTLLWAILLGAMHPDIQKRVQDEIDANVGKQFLPKYDQRNMLPFTEAFVMEVLRFGGVVSQIVPHSTSFGPVNLNGYVLPKDTVIFMHTDLINKSEKFWGDPQNFRPDRFINDHGNVELPAHFFPFGTGKRVCLGEPLARMEIFLFFACLMQNFSFRLADGCVPETIPEYGVFLRPATYSVIPTCR